MNGNYVRLQSLSFSSIEIYMLGFLLVLYMYILFKRKEQLDVKLICMYILALPYTDIVYRFHGIQISEIIIGIVFIKDICCKKIKISKNPLCRFMILFSMILLASTILSVIQNVYNNGIYGNGLTPIDSILNNIKFILITYMINKIIVIINTVEKLELIIDMVRFSGNITAFVSIMQAVLYKLGFWVPGIFEMWGIPRPKGLSHEPATNAFVLLTTIATVIIYKAEGNIKFHFISLILQGIAFLLCLSSGAIPILCLYIILFAFLSVKKTKKAVINIFVGVIVIICLGFAIARIDTVSDVTMRIISKVNSMVSDYQNGMNISGRGTDILMVNTVKEHNLYFGYGAFNSTDFFPECANTNEYFILFSELGVVGTSSLLIVLIGFLVPILTELKKTKGKFMYSNIFAFMGIVPMVIGWIRVLFFHQIWVIFALEIVLINLHKSNIMICLQKSNPVKKSVA